MEPGSPRQSGRRHLFGAVQAVGGAMVMLRGGYDPQPSTTSPRRCRPAPVGGMDSHLALPLQGSDPNSSAPADLHDFFRPTASPPCHRVSMPLGACPRAPEG